MSRISWKLHVPEPPDPQAFALKELAETFSDSGFSELTLKHILGSQNLTPPRGIDAILENIINHKTEQISSLEWFFCLYKKITWDQYNPDQAYRTSTLIWEASKSNQWLRERLLWRLALYYDGDRQQILPKSMVKSFRPDHILCESHYEATRIILGTACHNNAAELASYCLSVSKLPSELLEDTQLPTYLQIAKSALTQIPQQFSHLSQITQASVDLLIRCLEKLPEEQQAKSVNHILVSVDKEIGGNQTKLVDWLEQNYGVSQSGAKWGMLSSKARENLRKWIGAINYSDFKRLIDQVLACIKLDDREERQLKSRREFWSNYSDRFEQIRILLPQSTAQILSQDFQTSDIGVFAKQAHDIETEVCIFDFGAWYVVEFFRGAGSETRLFPKTPLASLSEKLFESPIPSPNCLRCLGGHTHDHRYYWQISCEKWLRERGIKPNAGLTQFKRVGKSDPYHPDKGLEFPPNGDWVRRSKQEAAARSQIRELERKAHQDCCRYWED